MMLKPDKAEFARALESWLTGNATVGTIETIYGPDRKHVVRVFDSQYLCESLDLMLEHLAREGFKVTIERE